MNTNISKLLAALTLAGCVGADPALPTDDCAPMPEAAALVCGDTDGATFTPFAAGDTLVILDGKQGGTWVMPAVELTGLGREGTLSASVALDTGEIVGAIAGVQVHLDADPTGDARSGRLDYVPIPIAQQPDALSVAELVDREAVLRVELRDACGREAHSATAMILDHEGAR
jgi:hypothetical protein